MAEIAKDKVFKQEVMGIKDYINQFHPGLQPQSIAYAIDNDKVDFIKVGHERLIVMTEKTRQYVPNTNVNRDEGPKNKVRVNRTSGTEA